MKRRGFALIVSFLLLLVIFVLGIGFLSKRSALYRAALSTRAASQARLAALAGVEDCRVKLEKDLHFPPFGSLEQKVFTYSEGLANLAGVEQGGYLVTVDKRLITQPFAVIRITSVGYTGPADRPLATRQIDCELDASPVIRGTTDPNPNYFHFLNWLDGGAR